MLSFLRRASLVAGVALVAVGCQSTGGKGSGGGPETRPAGETKPKASGSRSVAELRAATHDSDFSVRFSAVEELGPRASSSEEAAQALVEALADPAPLVRRFAAGGLARVQSVSSPMILALSRLLRDPEVDPRESAARTLAALAPRAPADSVPGLASALAAAASDPDESVKTRVVEALGALGAAGVRAVPAVRPALERALGDSSEQVRGAAAAAIGQLGTGVLWSVTLLTKALADPVHDVRKQAVVALEKIGPDAAPATKALARQLHGKEIYLRVFAADALAAIGPGARAALPDLKALKARGWKDLENSPESEATQLPEAVARAIKNIEAKETKKGTKKP